MANEAISRCEKMMSDAERKFEAEMERLENLDEEDKANGKWIFSVLNVMHSEIAMLTGMVCALIDNERGKE